MKAHVENAKLVASFLEANDMVDWVNYPGLESHAGYELAKKYMPDGAGSMLAFGIKGGRAAGATFIENLDIFSHLANVGDAKSLVLHPASTTHQQLSSEQLTASGIGEDLIRMSVGLEDITDIITDLKQGLRAASKCTPAAK
jgi:O-acetylhomoserine (thiol)-lyase